MATALYPADPEILDSVKALIGQHHPDLALVADKILILFQDKTWTSGGRRVYGRVQMPTPMMRAVLPDDQQFEFVFLLGADGWSELSSRQKNAQLDELLCACSVEEVEADNDDPNYAVGSGLKCRVIGPDIAAFRENVQRFGVWHPVLGDRPPQDGADLIEAVVKTGVEPTFIPVPPPN